MKQKLNQTIRGSLLAVTGVGCLVFASFSSTLRLFALVLGLFLLLLAATSLSRATQIAASLPPLKGQPVHVKVWGNALPATGGELLRVDSIRTFGAAILIHLRLADGGQRNLLKIAQPGPAQIQSGRLEITRAAYVSWAGTRLPRTAEAQPALVLSWPAA